MPPATGRELKRAWTACRLPVLDGADHLAEPAETERKGDRLKSVPTRLRRLDFDAPGLGLRDLGNRELEDAVLEGRLDGIGLHVLRQREAAHELAGHALDARVAVFFLALLEGTRAAQGEHTLVGGDLDVGRLHARQVCV